MNRNRHYAWWFAGAATATLASYMFPIPSLAVLGVYVGSYILLAGVFLALGKPRERCPSTNGKYQCDRPVNHGGAHHITIDPRDLR